MKFEDFCRALGFNPATISDVDRTRLLAIFENCDTRNIQVEKDSFVRVFKITPNTFNKESRSVRAAVLTDAPVWMYDWDRGWIQEVLPIETARMPERMPLLDSHNTHTTKAVYGSCTDLRNESNGERRELAATLVFARDPESQAAMEKVEDGHITDLSGGYRVYKARYLNDGEEFKLSANGKTYRGPMKIALDWEPHEGSLCPVGADQFAKIRSQNTNNGTISAQSAAATHQRNAENNLQEATAMNFKSFCRSLGIDAAALTDAQRAALESVFDAYCKDLEENAEIPATAKERAAKIMKADEEARKRGEEAVRARIKSIEDVCILAGLPDEKTRELVKDPEMDQARAIEAIKKFQAENKPPLNQARTPDISIGENRHVEHVRTAGAQGLAMHFDSRVKIDKPAEHAQAFRVGGTERVIRELLSAHGVDVRMMSKSEVIDEMLKRSYVMDDFAHLTADAAHIKLAVDVAAAETVYQFIFEITDVKDFKKNHRVRLMDSSSLQRVSEDGEYQIIKLSDEGSYVQVFEHGGSIPLTRKVLIDDMLGALFTAAGRVVTRTQLDIEELAIGNLINNKMFDGTQVFTSGRKNIGTSAALSNASLDEARMLLAAIKGDKGQALGLKGKFILTGAKYARAAAEIVTSTSSTDSNKNAGVDNYYRGKMQAFETSVITDGAWYLLGNPAMEPTGEVAFMNGQRTPTVTPKERAGQSGILLDINMDYGAAIHSWRNMIKNAGA